MSFQYDPFSHNKNDETESNAKKVAKHATKKVKKRAIKTLAKGAGKLAVQGVKAGLAALAKALAILLSTIGLPAVFVLVGIILLIIIITLVSSAIFGGGVDLDSDQQDLHDHIVEESNNTVDLDNPEQAPYKVPVELLSSVVQLEAMQDDDHYEVVSDMAETLKPTFTYSDDFNEWTETKTKVCEKSEEDTEEDCEAWSDTDRVDNWVTKLIEIEYWQGNIQNDYTEKVTNWKTTVDTEIETETVTETVTQGRYEDKTLKETITKKVPYTVIEREIYIDYNGMVRTRPVRVTKYREVEEVIEQVVPVYVEEEVEIEKEIKTEIRTYTKTRNQYYTKKENKKEDYTYLDTALNSLDFGINDKRLLEVNYNFQDAAMNYIAWLEGNTVGGGSGDYGGAVPYPGTIVPGSDIPSQYMQYYLAAEKKYGVHWYILASVHRQETVFSTIDPMISSAGAEGHMQFMPCTWLGWAYPGCKGTNGMVSVSDLIMHDPSSIEKYGGYGTDGNGDGVASPWDIEDAIFTAAHYLSSSGYSKDPRSAILNYNHASWYADEVLARADKYKTEAVYNPSNPDVQLAIDAANSWIGKPNKYVFGGGRSQSDISIGHFDCSSFVHWAYSQAGIDMGSVGSVSTETLNKMGSKVPFNQIQPGDIIFFDTYKSDGHVGIWLGNGKWIGTQGSTGIAVIDQNSNTYWQGVFSGHVRRIF